jgi:SAM-dependent methyltransferase
MALLFLNNKGQMQMKSHSLYSVDEIKKTYEQTNDHVHTKFIITKYSTNQRDIRTIALNGLDLSHALHVLELGCGYGSFTKNLVGRIGHGAEIIGVDMVPENGPIFLSTVEAMGYRGNFINDSAELIRHMGDSRFDLIIASYSLYFFPHLIKEIARLLNPTNGIFITISHSKYSLGEVLRLLPKCMEELGLEPIQKTSIARLFETFSLEDGLELLQPYFQKTDKIVYENALLFSKENIVDCIDYLEKKSTLLFKDVLEKYPLQLEDIRRKLYENISKHAEEKGQIAINKDDVIFQCSGPRKIGSTFL